jgi:hypothetical protein
MLLEVDRLEMVRARKILIPDVPPPRVAGMHSAARRGIMIIAGIGLCGLTGVIVVALLVL